MNPLFLSKAEAFLGTLAMYTGPVSLMRILHRSKAPIFTYHSVSNRVEGEPTCLELAGMTMPRESFVRQMEYLAKHFTPVSFSDIALWHAGAKQLPKRPCIITFDDGLANVYDDVVPVLERLNLTATFFIIGKPLEEGTAPWLHGIYALVDAVPFEELIDVLRREVVGFPADRRPDKAEVVAWFRRSIHEGRDGRHQRARLLKRLRQAFALDETASPSLFMSAGQIRELHEKGFEIGCHSQAHEYLTRLTPEELDQDIRRSKAAVSKAIGADPRVFCYPFGNPESLNADVVAAVRRHGFECACSTETGFNGRTTDPLALMRINVSGCRSLPEFVFRVHGLAAASRSILKTLLSPLLRVRKGRENTHEPERKSPGQKPRFGDSG